MRPLLPPAPPLLLLAALLALFYLQSPAEAQELKLQTETGVETMPLEDYLIGAVAGEMPALFPDEALKAQAVAIRSYALAQRGRHGEADLCDDPSCCLRHLDEAALQALWGEGYAQYRARIAEACAQTRGEYLAYGGQAALAVFHASSHGQTENSGDLWSPLPYLVSVASPETEQDVPNFATELRISNDTLAQTLGLDDVTLGALSADGSGRVSSLTLGGQSFSGAQLRQLLGLRSHNFRVLQTERETVFSVLGSGHGVGMSQYGAKVYAMDGLSYEEILAHYYPDTELIRPAAENTY